APQPSQAGVVGAVPAGQNWQCSCGAVNQGKFCSNCGNKRPAEIHYRCDKCGWEPQGQQIPKFCPECGDKFDEQDRV
ncbi:MAG: hypothetical protein Q4P08_04710, partial [Eubacteriales bacterium]|nr:hypothetical protein [Eubacteriales bacterium]